MGTMFGSALRTVEINLDGMLALDWAIVIGMIVVLVSVLLYCNRYMRNAADFLAANRCAGRYVMSISEGIAGLGLISAVASWEAFMKSGFAGTWWGMISAPFTLILSLIAWVTYRMRETRCFTLAQFYEVRYSKKFRLCAGMITFLSGVLNYGLFPMVSVKFLMAFCSIPEHYEWLGVNWNVYGILLAFCIGLGVFFAAFGGQVAIMVTDFMQGIFCNIAFVIFIFFIFKLGDWDVSGGFVSWDQIAEALDKTPGQSQINPYLCDKIPDFNIWYYLIGLAGLFYSRGGWQGSAGYAAAAKNPHERKMAGVMGTWRGLAQGLIMMLFPLAVMTIMSSLPEFAELREVINGKLDLITNETEKLQETVPVALSLIMPSGLLGLFVAVMFSAMLSTDDTYMHSWGSILIQDIVMPFRKKPFTPKQHIWALRLGILFVGVFGWLFSFFWVQNTPVLLFFSITGAIVSGAGPAIIGGLYWKRGGTIAAWVSYIVGSTCALAGIAIQQCWKGSLAPWLLENFGWEWVANNMKTFPVNGQYISFINMLVCTGLYVIISLIEHRAGKPDFNLDKMLHRGIYDTNNEHGEAKEGGAWLAKLFGITPEFTLGDKLIYAGSILWTIVWCGVFMVYTILWFSNSINDTHWLALWHAKIYVTLVLGVICTVWFLIGGLVDVVALFKALKNSVQNDADDGSVVDGGNSGESKL